MKLIILGGGESGTGSAKLGKKLGYDVFLSDKGKLADKYKQQLTAMGVEYEEENHTLEKIFTADLVVKSPGIPDTMPIILELLKRGIEVISEIEFAGRNTKAKMCCITGSNGKTTTTLLTKHILQEAGVDAGLAGNIGQSLSAQVANEAHDLYIVELSSFQLDGMYDFKCDIAALTNITPDHLDRYDHKFENYINSKFRIINNMKKEDFFIYGMDSEEVGKKISNLKITPETAGFTYSNDNKSNAYMNGNVLIINYNGKSFTIDKSEISIKGRHNVYNSMAAILICMHIGLSNDDIARGLKSFPQVEHRLETCLVKDGVTYINDSKATNVDSSWYALDSMSSPIIWIAGGTDKGNNYNVLLDLVKEKVKVLICMGVDNQKLIESFQEICKIEDTHSLDEAVKIAKAYAQNGDTVLLSPCCASFDLFKNYENRGELFKAKVKELNQ